MMFLKNIQFNGDDGFGFISYGIDVQNNTEETINTITLNIVYLDDNGNIFSKSFTVRLVALSYAAFTFDVFVSFVPEVRSPTTTA